MDKTRKAVVGILSVKTKQRDRRGPVNREPAELVDTMELGKTIGDLLGDPHWRAKLTKKLEEYGHKVHALSIMRQDNDGYNIAATVVDSIPNVRGKPVSRGGKPIGTPVTGRKTMAQHRRK